MLKRKRIKERGKISFSRFFQIFKEGDYVAVTRDLGVSAGFPKKIQGRTGRVLSKRGEAYVVEIKDLDSPKKYIIRPVHLKGIEVAPK